MKKILAICALIFAIGMIVNFSPGETPPAEEISQYDVSDWAVAQLEVDENPVYLLTNAIEKRAFLVASDKDIPEADLVEIIQQVSSSEIVNYTINQPHSDDFAEKKSNVGQFTTLSTNPTEAHYRSDKKLDPGRCS